MPNLGIVDSKLKQALLNICVDHINQRISNIHSQLALIEESRDNETKSSAGDKYETGRAMMQMEEDKCRTQLHDAMAVMQVLQGIDPNQLAGQSGVGSIVVTSIGNYFIAVGLGKVIIDGTTYYCISPESPVGLTLKGKTAGETAEFRGRPMVIETIT